MSPLEQSIREGTAHITLTTEERTHMRAHLEAYMAYHPLRERATQAKARIPGVLFSYFRTHHLMGAALIAVLITTSTYGVSSAAERALPGDLLYPVKVDVNEELKTVLLSSDAERIAWEQERASRRLTEASTLASEGRLDSEKMAEVGRRFAEHAESVVAQAQAVEAEDPVLAAEVTADFETSLDAHESVLARLAVETMEGEGGEETRGLMEQVRGVAMETGKVRSEVEEKIARTLTDDAVQEEGDARPGSTAAETGERVALRDRALSRASERAVRARAETEEVLKATDDELITARVEGELAGVAALEQEAQTLQSSGDMVGAYQLYKLAAMNYQKITHSMHVAELLDITPVPISSIASTALDTTAMTMESQAEGASTTTDQVQESPTEQIEEVEKLLSDTSPTHREARSLLREARANALRGDIAQTLGDSDAATRLYTDALLFAEKAQEVGAPVSLPDTSTSTESEKPTGDDFPSQDDVPDMPALDTVTVYHEYASGTHRYSGHFYTPTPCFVLSAKAVVAESLPEQVSVELSTTEGDGACAMVLDRKPFSVEVAASPEARFVGVSVNGTVSKWNLVEGQNPDPVEERAPTPSTPTPASAMPTSSSGTSSLLERAFGATAALLRP